MEDYAAGEIKPKKLNNQSDFKRVYKQNIASTSNQNSSTRKKPNKEQESTSKEEVQQALWTIIFVILILAWLIFSLAY